MYLFTRSARIAPGHTRDALAWAHEMTDLVNKGTDLQVGLWTQVFSPETGTVAWSTGVEDLNQLEAAEDKLMADDHYQAMVDRGVAYVPGGVQDGLIQVIHGEPDPQRTIGYISVVRSVCATAGLAKGIELGIALAEKSTEIGGAPTLFGMESTGAFGAVCWITGYVDLSELQASEGKVYADPGFMALLDGGAGDAYAADPFASTQRIYRRIV